MKKLIRDVNGDSKEVDMRQPTGKEVKKLRQALNNMRNAKDSGKGLDDYMSAVEEVSVACTGISIEEMDALPFDQKNILTDPVHESINKDLDFSRRFGTSVASVHKTKPAP